MMLEFDVGDYVVWYTDFTKPRSADAIRLDFADSETKGKRILSSRFAVTAIDAGIDISSRDRQSTGLSKFSGGFRK